MEPSSSRSSLSEAIINKKKSNPSSQSLSDTISDDIQIETLPPEISRLKLNHDATIKEIEQQIVKCKNQIYKCEECSIERKWLVRYLVELRLRLEELKDVDNNSLVKKSISILGHHMIPFSAPLPSTKQFCEQCSGTIWSVVQSSYVCQDCNYLCHAKCVKNIYRVCTHVITAEKGGFETNICPVRGLGMQMYECIECRSPLKCDDSFVEPRLCDYSGSYYCSTCHWNNTAEIPARIVHNWDWKKRSVSRASLQYLHMNRDRLFINLETTNPFLFNTVSELAAVKKLRTEDLKSVHRYLMDCKTGKNLITTEMLVMIEVPHMYSISMLEMTRNGTLEKNLNQMVEMGRLHITNCTICSAKGYYCAHCNHQKGIDKDKDSKKNEILYPFDSGTVLCIDCNSLYHKVCHTKLYEGCYKCNLLKKRAESNSSK